MQQLTAFTRQQINTVHTLAGKPVTAFTEENFHQLRVSIKKVRAVYTITNQPEDLYLHTLKQLFAQAGKVRELQLELEQIQRYPQAKMPVLRAMLTRELQYRHDLFFQIRHMLSAQLLTEPAQLLTATRKMKKKDLTVYLSDHSRTLAKKMATKQVKSRQLHRLRKKIKILVYILDAGALAAGTPLLRMAGDLSDQLGKWHDLRVLSGQLNKAMAMNGAGETEKKNIRHLRRNVQQRSGRQRKKLEKMLHRL